MCGSDISEKDKKKGLVSIVALWCQVEAIVVFNANNLCVTISSFFIGHIDATTDENGGRWRFTSFYSSPARDK